MFRFVFIISTFLLISFNGFTKNNLLELISQNKDFSIFYKLINVANYQELFNKKTEFKKILYIPDNEAFSNLPKKIKDKIMDKEIAKKIVRTHLYPIYIRAIRYFL